KTKGADPNRASRGGASPGEIIPDSRATSPRNPQTGYRGAPWLGPIVLGPGSGAAVPAPGCGWIYSPPDVLGPVIRLYDAGPDGAAAGGAPGGLVKLPA